MHHILMLSSSRMGQEAYLEHATTMIYTHLANIHTAEKPVVFVPYAGVTMTYDDYTEKVKAALTDIRIKGIHEYDDAKTAIQHAGSIMIGGGNTFRLLDQLYQHNLVGLIQQRVAQGLAYIGWSAGSNICGATIRTTNDMPIIEPSSFDSLGFVPCQINPHYSEYQPPNHNGETRDQRLSEFTTLNPETPVLAIREGTALLQQGNNLSLQGTLGGYAFIGNQKRPIHSGESLNQYIT